MEAAPFLYAYPRWVGADAPPRGNAFSHLALSAARAEKFRDVRILAKFRDVLGRGKLRPVPLPVHHAEKAERLLAGSAELMPAHRGHSHQIELCDRANLAADQTPPVAAQDHHRMDVFMTLQRRISAGRNLEIAQFACQIVGAEQRLPRDILER